MKIFHFLVDGKKTSTRHKNFKGKKGLCPPLRSFVEYRLCSIYDFLLYSSGLDPGSWKHLLSCSTNQSPSAKISKTSCYRRLELMCNVFVGIHARIYETARPTQLVLGANNPKTPPQQSPVQLLCARLGAARRTFSPLRYSPFRI